MPSSASRLHPVLTLNYCETELTTLPPPTPLALAEAIVPHDHVLVDEPVVLVALQDINNDLVVLTTQQRELMIDIGGLVMGIDALVITIPVNKDVQVVGVVNLGEQLCCHFFMVAPLHIQSSCVILALGSNAQVGLGGSSSLTIKIPKAREKVQGSIGVVRSKGRWLQIAAVAQWMSGEMVGS